MSQNCLMQFCSLFFFRICFVPVMSGNACKDAGFSYFQEIIKEKPLMAYPAMTSGKSVGFLCFP